VSKRRSHNQQDAKFLNLFISVRRSTCFRRFYRPSLGAQNCTYSVRYWSDKYLTLYVQFWAPADGRKNRLIVHVERLTEINKLWNVASFWLYSENILAMNGPMNVTCINGPSERLRIKRSFFTFALGLVLIFRIKSNFKFYCIMRDFRFAPRSSWELRSSELLRGEWW